MTALDIADRDARAMRAALDAAVRDPDETPVGAVLVDAAGETLAAAGNTTRSACDPTGHAEINVLRAAAARLGNFRLTGTTLYVTLEPCAMCAGAISHARVARLVVAAWDPKGGAVRHGPRYFEQPTCHWRPEIVQGPFADEASRLLVDFFRARRG
ncbi:MAG: nucleoside deaminase [Pseudomonadota bacterium]